MKKFPFSIYPPYLHGACLIFIGALVAYLGSLSWKPEKAAAEDLLQRKLSKSRPSEGLQLEAVKNYQKVDLHSFKKTLASRQLLETEKGSLHHLIQASSYPLPSFLQTRLKWLESSQNRLRFEESASSKKSGVEERIETLSSPVELDANDLLYCINLIESKRESPHLIFKELQVQRKESASGWEVFYLQKLEMIKRDYTCFFDKSF